MMTKDELEKHHAAADKAQADLEAARAKQADAQAEAERVAAERSCLPLDEKKIAAHIDREKASALKLEIAARLVTQAESVLAEAKDALQRADWQYRHDELAARGVEIANALRTRYARLASEMATLFADIKSFDDAFYGFSHESFRRGLAPNVTIRSPATLAALVGFDQARLPRLDGRSYWPVDRPRSATNDAVSESLDRLIG